MLRKASLSNSINQFNLNLFYESQHLKFYVKYLTTNQTY